MDLSIVVTEPQCLSQLDAEIFLKVATQLFKDLGEPEPDVPKILVMETKSVDPRIAEQIHFIRFVKPEVSGPNEPVVCQSDQAGCNQHVDPPGI